MQVDQNEKRTYLYLNGIKVSNPVSIGDQINLQPANCVYNESVLKSFSSSDISYGTALIFLPLISGQICIENDDSEKLVMLAWNSLWDGVLLGALYDCNVSCNFQANTAAHELQNDSRVEITNYHFHGLTTEPYELTESDNAWLEENFSSARKLLDIPEFQHAVHCLSTYRWHSYSGARLAIIWSGIEGLFKIESEIVFRLSLYISRFLEPAEKLKRKELFNSVKKLYKLRSSAVHGSKIKGNAEAGVKDSAALLNRLIRECIKNGGIPCAEELAP